MRIASALLVLVALVALAALGSCKRLNGRYCDEHTACPLGHTCDTVARECISGLGGNGDMNGNGHDMAGGCNCTFTQPVCVPPGCFGCDRQPDPEAACNRISTATSHCLTSGPDTGACVACRDDHDCAAPTAVCDAATHACRGCNADSDCASRICVVDPDAPEHGQCVDAGQVVYVDGSKAQDGDGLTVDSPRLRLQDGINTANSVGRPYVQAAAHTYAENLSIDGSKKVSLVGAPGAIVHPAGGDAIVISGGGALTLRGFVVTAPGNGASCSGSTSKLVAMQTQFVSAGQNGVYTSTCPLTLDACFIDSNGAAGVVISTDFTIRNSIITRNKTQGGVQQIGPPNNAVFFNNTIADNSGPTGVSCGAGAFVVNNSIFYNNRNAGGLSETTCATQNSAGDIDGFKIDLRSQPPGFKQTGSGADYYHLAPTSPCRNQGAREGAPTHDYDLETRPDPTSNLVDIGADEIE